jgi:hypothetical protein
MSADNRSPARNRTLMRRPSELKRKNPAALIFSGSIQPFIAEDVAFLTDVEWAAVANKPGDVPVEPVRPPRRMSYAASLFAEAFGTPAPAFAPDSATGLQTSLFEESTSIEMEPAGITRSGTQGTNLSQETLTNFPTRAPVFIPRVNSWSGLKDLLLSRRNIHTLRAVVSLLIMLTIMVLIQPTSRFFGPDAFFSVLVTALLDYTLTIGSSLAMFGVALLMCTVSAGAVCMIVALCSLGGTTVNAAGVLILLFFFSFSYWLVLANHPHIFPPFFSAAAILYFGICNAIFVVGYELTLNIGGVPNTVVGTPWDAYLYTGKMALGIVMGSFVSCLCGYQAKYPVFLNLTRLSVSHDPHLSHVGNSTNPSRDRAQYRQYLLCFLQNRRRTCPPPAHPRRNRRLGQTSDPPAKPAL